MPVPSKANAQRAATPRARSPSREALRMDILRLLPTNHPHVMEESILKAARALEAYVTGEDAAGPVPETPPFLETLAARLKFAREKAGIGQSELARLIGVRPQSIQAIEIGRVTASSRIPILARILKVNEAWLGGPHWQRAATP